MRERRSSKTPPVPLYPQEIPSCGMGYLISPEYRPVQFAGKGCKPDYVSSYVQELFLAAGKRVAADVRNDDYTLRE